MTIFMSLSEMYCLRAFVVVLQELHCFQYANAHLSMKIYIFNELMSYACRTTITTMTTRFVKMFFHNFITFSIVINTQIFLSHLLFHLNCHLVLLELKLVTN